MKGVKARYGLLAVFRGYLCRAKCVTIKNTCDAFWAGDRVRLLKFMGSQGNTMPTFSAG